MAAAVAVAIVACADRQGAERALEAQTQPHILVAGLRVQIDHGERAVCSVDDHANVYHCVLAGRLWTCVDDGPRWACGPADSVQGPCSACVLAPLRAEAP